GGEGRARQGRGLAGGPRHRHPPHPQSARAAGDRQGARSRCEAAAPGQLLDDGGRHGRGAAPPHAGGRARAREGGRPRPGGGLEEVKLARRGKLFTFTNDYLFESPDPPTSHAVIDLEGGGRLYCQLTDCEPERVEIDMPLELTFRRIHEGGGFNNYFWKARP